MESILSIKNLSKKYKKSKSPAVDDINFEVKKGEFFAFLGPNGAGKTTTISILTTTLSKTSGQVTVAGFDLDKEASSVRQNIGVIFQKPSLDENLTAEENMRFHAILYGMYPFRPLFSLMPKNYKNRVQRLSKLLDIDKDIHKPIKTFSGGMKRKLEIIRSLMHKPRILFLDEPTAGLDPLSRKNLWKYLVKVKDSQNLTIFLTTHYLEEAEDADRIGIINKGNIEVIGTPRTIKQKLLKEYLIIDSNRRDKLIKELKSKNIQYTINENIEIPIEHSNAQDIIKRIDTQLSTVDIHNPTLEEAYLDIIQNSHADSKRD